MEFSDDAIFVHGDINVDALPEVEPDSCTRVWAQMVREADEREAREELEAMPAMATCQVEPVLEEHVKMVGHACADGSVEQGNDMGDDCSDITPTEPEESGSEDGDHPDCPMVNSAPVVPDVAVPTCAPASVGSKHSMDKTVP